MDNERFEISGERCQELAEAAMNLWLKMGATDGEALAACRRMERSIVQESGVNVIEVFDG